MEEKDRKGFLVLMAMSAEAFKEEVSKERAKIYFEFLRKYSLYQVMQALNHSIRTSKFFPRVADLEDFLRPDNHYPRLESDKARDIRLKQEEKRMLDYIGQISRILGAKKERTALPYKEDR